MDLQSLESALETGLALTQELAPLAALAGPQAAAAGKLVAGIAGFAAEILPTLESDTSVIASGDLTRIKALHDQLQAENDALAAQVDQS